jgi:RNA polymerase sigma factor (sigma-70 family)
VDASRQQDKPSNPLAGSAFPVYGGNQFAWNRRWPQGFRLCTEKDFLQMEASTLALRSAARIPLSRKLLAALSDEKLVAHVRSGSEAAFEVVFDRYHRPILAFCRHMLGSQHESEDVVQGTFAAAYADLLRSRSEIHLKPWLFTIARNRCLSALRARRESCAELDPESLAAGLAEEVERRADLRALVADIAELPEQQRAALVLAELRALSHPEIAEVLGCEAGKVKSLVFQARSALIDSRKARETPCDTIRGELATLTRGSLRRTYLRKHLRECPGCSEFRAELKRQRAMMGAVLPVVPSVALKHQTLSAVGLGGGSAAGAGGVVAGLGSQAVAVKIAVAVAVGGASAGGAALEMRRDAPPAAPARPSVRTIAQDLPAPTFTTHGRHSVALAPPATSDPRPGARSLAPAGPPAVEPAAEAAPAPEHHALDMPPAAEHNATPAPSTPHGQNQAPVADKPDDAAEPPAPEAPPSSGNSGSVPGRTQSEAPGNSGSGPGHPGEAPGTSGSAPGQGGEVPGNAGGALKPDPPGNSASAPGHAAPPAATPGPPAAPGSGNASPGPPPGPPGSGTLHGHAPPSG